MLPEEMRAKLEQLEGELLVLKHVIRIVLAAHRRSLSSPARGQLDLKAVRQVRREIQALWAQEWREITSHDPRSP